MSVVVLMRVYISVKFTKKYPSDLAFGSLDAYEVDNRCEVGVVYLTYYVNLLFVNTRIELLLLQTLLLEERY